jgi:hypothetical protein
MVVGLIKYFLCFLFHLCILPFLCFFLLVDNIGKFGGLVESDGSE